MPHKKSAHAARSKRRDAVKPHWDPERRQLWFASVLVKTFHRIACCQELILAAFEEQGWPSRMDSPLPGGEHAHEALRNAAKKLNQQLNGLFGFHLDGTGKGITWERTVSNRIARRGSNR
jgi:hypothetical protein